MAQGAGNTANGQLVKGAGSGTREWREDFVLTDTDGVTPLFKIAKADGTMTAQGVSSVSTSLTLSGTLAVTGASTLTGAVTASAGLSAGTSLTLAGIETGLTAHAGGTQAAALGLSATKIVHNVATVGTAADSVVLPASAGGGKVHIVMNSAASNSMQVFGLSADTINGVTAATGVALAASKSAIFVDYAAGTWFMLKSA